MMNRFWKGKKGVTLLEGLIAIGLLAMVSVSTFSVLLSISRRATQPDIREEMFLAIERAHEGLQRYTQARFDPSNSFYQQGLCSNITDTDPMGTGEHDIKCMLPAMCGPTNSSFKYTVSDNDISSIVGNKLTAEESLVPSGSESWFYTIRNISFNITCNGYTL